MFGCLSVFGSTKSAKTYGEKKNIGHKQIKLISIKANLFRDKEARFKVLGSLCLGQLNAICFLKLKVFLREKRGPRI